MCFFFLSFFVFCYAHVLSELAVWRSFAISHVRALLLCGLQRPRHTRGILQGFGINSVAISDHWVCLGDKDTSGPQPS